MSARRFGVEVGVVALAAGLLLAYRGVHLRLAAVALAVGVLLLTAAVLRPTLLAPVARRWMQLASRISRFSTPIMLSIVYLLVLTPVAWIRRTFGRSPIARDPHATTYWVRREQTSAQERRDSMERRF